MALATSSFQNPERRNANDIPIVSDFWNTGLTQVNHAFSLYVRGFLRVTKRKTTLLTRLEWWKDFG